MLISINTTQARPKCDIFVSESNNNGVRVSLNASKVSQKHQHRFSVCCRQLGLSHSFRWVYRTPCTSLKRGVCLWIELKLDLFVKKKRMIPRFIHKEDLQLAVLVITYKNVLWEHLESTVQQPTVPTSNLLDGFSTNMVLLDVVWLIRRY